jgi:hypothetical protein
LRILIGSLAIFVAAFVLWGIGSAVRRLAHVRPGRWPVSIGIGVAVLVFLGGLLNMMHLAYRPVLWIVIVAAIGVSIVEGLRLDLPLERLSTPDKAARLELVLAAIVISAVMLFAIATQLPPREFNYHDDLQKYFTHPVRMIETGTLRGSPLSALGSETLGGQAFLHALVVSVAPFPYVNGVDAIFGLFALMLIAAAAGWRRFGWLPGAAVAALTVAIINPLDANISGLYTAATLMATAVLLVADEGEEASPFLLGPIYAALVAIKPTFAIFAALHCLLASLAVASYHSQWKRILAWPAKVTAWATAAILPWLIMYIPTYIQHGAFLAKASPLPGDSAGVTLLSTAAVFDGDGVASYSAIACLAVFVAILALWAWFKSRQQAKPSAKPLGLLAGALSGIGCYLFLILYLSRWGGYQFCVRYTVPYLLGACVISALMAPSLIQQIPRALCTLLPAVACMALMVLFAPSALARDQRAIRYGSILEFAPLAMKPDYEPYIQFSLSVAARQQIARYQDAVPAGQPLFAWIDTPYLLDFRRNQIIDVDTAGTATPWAHVPPNVFYFLWQYSGYAVRKQGDYEMAMHEPGIGARERMIAARTYALANVLSELSSRSQVIASDDQYVLFKVAAVK